MGGAASRFANSALSMKSGIQDYLQRPRHQPPILPTSAVAAAADPEPGQGHNFQRTVSQPHKATGHVEWLLVVYGLCFTALGTAAQCLQTLRFQPTNQGIPVTYYMFCFVLILTLNTLVLSRFIASGFHFQNKLEPLGLLFGMVAFILAVTLPFPLWFKLTSWACFASSLVILVSVWYFRGGSTGFHFSRELANEADKQLATRSEPSDHSV